MGRGLKGSPLPFDQMNDSQPFLAELPSCSSTYRLFMDGLRRSRGICESRTQAVISHSQPPPPSIFSHRRSSISNREGKPDGSSALQRVAWYEYLVREHLRSISVNTFRRQPATSIQQANALAFQSLLKRLIIIKKGLRLHAEELDVERSECVFHPYSEFSHNMRIIRKDDAAEEKNA